MRGKCQHPCTGTKYFQVHALLCHFVACTCVYVWNALHCTLVRFLFWPLVFSRALGCGARRGGVCTHGASLGPWPCSVGGYSGCQKSFDLTSNDGVAFRLAEPRRTTETHNVFILLCCCCITSASHRASSSQVLYHVAATVQKQPYIKFVSFVAATDGASVRVLVCAMFPVDVGNRNEHITT